MYDTELLWKRRFGLLYNPSQRAKFYLKDLDNWEEVTYRMNLRVAEYRMFYKPDPDFTYLMSEFVFVHWPWSYTKLAKEIFLRVIPVYRNEEEYDEFIEYVRSKGFRMNKIFDEGIVGEASERLKNTSIGLYAKYDMPEAAEYVAKELKENKDLVINFASSDNVKYNRITEYLRKGKMRVDWLEEWRHFRSDN